MTSGCGMTTMIHDSCHPWGTVGSIAIPLPVPLARLPVRRTQTGQTGIPLPIGTREEGNTAGDRARKVSPAPFCGNGSTPRSCFPISLYRLVPFAQACGRMFFIGYIYDILSVRILILQVSSAFTLSIHVLDTGSPPRSIAIAIGFLPHYRRES